MNKFLGYIIAGVGLAIVVLGSLITKISFLSSIPTKYVLIAGVIVIIVGIALTLNKSSDKVKHATEEVPIYQGVGKNRKIVGYRKD
jgi:predicted tellurium resistance membrane protein TerC